MIVAERQLEQAAPRRVPHGRAGTSSVLYLVLETAWHQRRDRWRGGA